MSVLTVRIPQELKKMLETFCKEEDRTKSWLIKKALREKLEDWNDCRARVNSPKEYKNNPSLVANHKKLTKELGLAQKEIDNTITKSI